MEVAGSRGTVAVRNDLGGSMGGVGVLGALNFNGVIDNTGVQFDASNKTSSVFWWNPSTKLCKTVHRC